MSSSRQVPGRRVVVTGMGIVSPLGIGREAFWASLSGGKSGISKIGLFSDSAAPHHVGGEVKEFTDKTAKNYIPHKQQKKNIKVMCREIQLGVASAMQALEDAGIKYPTETEAGTVDPERIGVDFGANLMLSPPSILKDASFACSDPELRFHSSMWGTVGLAAMQPLWLLQYLPNMPACHIGIGADARGPNNSMTMAEACGNMTVGEASRIIGRDAADVMITGTTGTTLHPVKTMHAAMWDQLADRPDDPAKFCRPFDLNRTGQVVAEGSATLILEEEGHARSRGATILGTVLGTGSACVTHGADRRPDIQRALVGAMRSALADAGLQPSDIGHINAHGLADEVTDRLEAAAIREVFGSLADTVPVTAFKSYFGNPGASCGTLEIAASLAGLLHGLVLPTLNYETPDPACALNVVHGAAQKTTNPIFLNINVTRMGQASAAVLQGAV